MKHLVSPEGLRKLRGALLIFVACVASTVVLIGVSNWYLGSERGQAAGAGTRLREARARLENVRRERDSVAQSEATFGELSSRGFMQPERRLDLVEQLATLRERFRISALDYEVAPQRALPLGGGRAYPAVEILSSRVTLRLRALHEGDLLGFIDALRESGQGLHPIDRCNLRRIEVANADAIQPRVEGECTLEWITLKEKKVG
jgi:hypothetical protein